VRVQFRRARFLSSDGTMYQGASSVSVAFSVMSRAREYSYQTAGQLFVVADARELTVPSISVRRGRPVET
jgi:hypothetical protein